MIELLRLVGYAFYAAAILVLLYEALLFCIKKEEGDNL
jgi:hypothetical protein